MILIYPTCNSLYIGVDQNTGTHRGASESQTGHLSTSGTTETNSDRRPVPLDNPAFGRTRLRSSESGHAPTGMRSAKRPPSGLFVMPGRIRSGRLAAGNLLGLSRRKWFFLSRRKRPAGTHAHGTRPQSERQYAGSQPKTVLQVFIFSFLIVPKRDYPASPDRFHSVLSAGNRIQNA